MPTVPFAIPICRHLKTNGLRCQSPTLNGELFCYFHVRLHKEHHRSLTAREIVDSRNLQYEGYEEAVISGGEDPMLIARAYPNQNEFHFPPLEDAESIQLAASMLFHAIAQGKVHIRRARLLRDMLRVAAASCRLNKPNPDLATSSVREIDHTPDGLAIASADLPSQPADCAPTQSSVSEPPQLSAPEPPPSSQELTSNQDFVCNPLGLNILPESPALTDKDSRFCDFFDAGLGMGHPAIIQTVEGQMDTIPHPCLRQRMGTRCGFPTSWCAQENGRADALPFG